jgi:hypothetical protein
VREYVDVVKEARAKGTKVHMARLFEIIGIKHWEIPGKQKAKARVVCQGNNVRDENGLAALFAEAASSASQIEASKMIDAISLLPNCAGSQADAVSAYTQAKLYGDGRVTKIDTWVELPKEQWPKAWVGQLTRPVVPLRLALYGHPLSGYFWEQHCTKSLMEVGFEPLEGWECIYVHKQLKLFLSVYVDDFKLAGLTENLSTGWSLTVKVSSRRSH